MKFKQRSAIIPILICAMTIASTGIISISGHHTNDLLAQPLNITSIKKQPCVYPTGALVE